MRDGQVTMEEAAGRVVRVIKGSFQKHPEKGMDTEAKIVPTGGVYDFLPPPPPSPSPSKTNRASWYVSR